MDNDSVGGFTFIGKEGLDSHPELLSVRNVRNTLEFKLLKFCFFCMF